MWSRKCRKKYNQNRRLNVALQKSIFAPETNETLNNTVRSIQKLSQCICVCFLSVCSRSLPKNKRILHKHTNHVSKCLCVVFCLAMISSKTTILYINLNCFFWSFYRTIRMRAVTIIMMMYDLFFQDFTHNSRYSLTQLRYLHVSRRLITFQSVYSVLLVVFVYFRHILYLVLI